MLEKPIRRCQTPFFAMLICICMLDGTWPQEDGQSEMSSNVTEMLEIPTKPMTAGHIEGMLMMLDGKTPHICLKWEAQVILQKAFPAF